MSGDEINVGKDLAERIAKSALKAARRLLDAPELDELQEELLKLASKGLLPNPDSLATRGGIASLLLSALIHREFARMASAALLHSGKLGDEALGAYLESLSIMLALHLTGKIDAEEEIARVLMELSLIASEAKDERISDVAGAVRTFTELLLANSKKLRRLE